MRVCDELSNFVMGEGRKCFLCAGEINPSYTLCNEELISSYEHQYKNGHQINLTFIKTKLR